MKKKTIFLIISLILSGSSYFIFVNNKKTNPIIKQVENFALYQEIVGTGEGFFDKTCPNEEFNEFLRLTESGSIKGLNLSGGIQTIITPNYYHWSNEKFLGFKSIKPPAFCNVGIVGPVHAYKDHLLWSNSCGGAIIQDNLYYYQYAEKYAEIEKIINNYFN